MRHKGFRRKSYLVVLFLVISWVMLTGSSCTNRKNKTNGNAKVSKAENQIKIQYTITCLGNRVAPKHSNRVILSEYKNPANKTVSFQDLCFFDGDEGVFPASTQYNSTWSGTIAKGKTVRLSNITIIAWGAKYQNKSEDITFTTALSDGKISGTVSYENEY